VLGPGLEEPHDEAIREILDQIDVPVVVDAAAIEPALGADLGPAVFGPDSAEVDRVEAEDDSLEAFSRESGAVVLEKGPEDAVIHGTDRWSDEAGTPETTGAPTCRHADPPRSLSGRRFAEARVRLALAVPAHPSPEVWGCGRDREVVWAAAVEFVGRHGVRPEVLVEGDADARAVADGDGRLVLPVRDVADRVDDVDARLAVLVGLDRAILGEVAADGPREPVVVLQPVDGEAAEVLAVEALAESQTRGPAAALVAASVGHRPELRSGDS
jgi:hypothetical protein